MRTWRTLSGSLVFAFLTGAHEARADVGQKVRLSWTRGARASACIDQPALEARIAARLGRAAFERSAPVSVEAYVTRDDRAWHASIQVRDASTGTLGSREFASESDSCAALEAAVALAVALVIDPDAPLSAPAPEVASVAAPAPSAAPGPLPPGRAATTPLPEADRRASFALHGTLAGGLLPGAAEGVDVTWSLGRWIGPSVSAFFFPEQRTPDRAFGFGLTALGLGACARPPGRSALKPGLCANLFAGALHAVVYEFVPTRPGAQAWVAASLAPHLRMSLGSRLFVELGGEILVPLLRDTFRVDGWSDPVFRQWPIAVRGFAGLGTDFP